MVILGLNAYHGDSAACILVEGKLIAAAEEERFRRIKHWAGFPTEAIRYCLAEAGISLDQVDHIAVNRNPSANLLEKVLFTFSKRPSLTHIKNRLTNASKIVDIKAMLCSEFHVSESRLKAEVHNIEHHRAHLASSFFVSPFDPAAVVSVDGFGDFVSTMWGTGSGNRLTISDQVNFPHSLGLFYLAMTQFLGFPRYGDEYKVMGLAPYGRPCEMDKMRKIVHLKSKGHFELELDYFLHHSEGVAMVWDNGEPTVGTVYSDKLIELLGPPRMKDEQLSDYHKNLAASLQEMYEDAFFHILEHVSRETKTPNLCLAGGCAMNSVANGKIFERSPFRELYVQSAAGDGGGAVGAAFYVWNQVQANPRTFVMDNAYLGPEFSNDEINSELRALSFELEKQGCTVNLIEDEDELCRLTAAKVTEGKVIGWFQGRMEWGPRALGNRSIICDPRRADMKDILNLKIKRRESFRPFAPSILRESVAEWFETDYDVPFMLQVYQIREEKRKLIPAVTHVNGSGRLQSVSKSQNPRYYRLIKAFEMITGVPVVLNTSFNENEPVVCKPEEALDCFLRTRMDVLVMGNWFVERKV
ncbi:MAG: carbamoyltransferase C-terminal domain-containing protein [Kiritimatiellae bacterium]|nr:carbamoyltransferase C-terminal domain-containing protein [Kiritimatiellia bacterium]MDD5521814.1 carbamoyltransferase C-terminal domain-containing protein [Kiritimatiellia bacterium]